MVKIFNRFTIPAKLNVLNFLFIFLVLSGVCSMLVTYYGSKKKSNIVENLADFEVAVKNITELSFEMRGDFFRAVAVKTETQPKYIHDLYVSVDDRVKSFREFQDYAKGLKSIFTEEIKSESAMFNSGLERYLSIYEGYSENLMDLSLADSDEPINPGDFVLDKIDKSFDNLRKAELQLIPAIQKYKNHLIQDIKRKKKNTFLLFLMLGTALMILLFVVIQFLKKSIVKPIKETEKILSKLSEGELLQVEEYEGSDELSRMLKSLKALSGHMQHIMKFVKNVAENNFDVEAAMFEGKGPIAMSLMNMRDSLKASYESENQRNWISKGLAGFGNLVRKHEDINTLYDSALHCIVKYLKANQGTLFLVDDSDKDDLKLERVATYAYDRKKFISGSFRVKDNLVGQVFLEGELVLLREVPDDYLLITSGLGEALPKNIIISPLISEEESFGILEIAAFKEFDNKEIELIKLIGEELAAVIKAAKIKINTQRLLKESQQQTEALRTQEEELRQNMEELQTAQEEVERIHNRNVQTLEQAIDGVITIDSNKNITFFNKAAEDMFGFRREEVIGNNVSRIIPVEHKKDHDSYVDNNIVTGSNKLIGMARDFEMTRKDDSRFWGQLSLSKIVIGDDIQFTAFIKDVTDKKLLEEDLQHKLEEMMTQEEELRQNMEELQAAQEEVERIHNRNIQTLEQAIDGVITIDSNKNIVFFNKAAEDMFGFRREEVIGNNVGKIIPLEHKKDHDGYIDNNIVTGSDKLIGIARDFEMTRKDGSRFWGQLSLSRVVVGSDIQFTAFIKDVTEKKHLEEELQHKMEKMMAQEVELRQNMEKLKQKEKENQEQLEELRAQEEELRQNMEELHVTQEMLEKRANELERANTQSEAQKQMMLKNLEKIKHKEQESHAQLEELQAREKELKQNQKKLEATQEEMKRQNAELLRLKANLEKEVEKKATEIETKNEEIIKKARMKAKEDRETKKVYETEISRMLGIWMSHLEAMEKKELNGK